MEDTPSGAARCGPGVEMVRVVAVRCKTWLIAAFALSTVVQAAEISQSDIEFSRVSNTFLEGYLAWRPQMATDLGFHDRDGNITDYSLASIQTERDRLRRSAEALGRLRPTELNPQNRYDLQILRAAVANELMRFESLDAYRANPMTYAGAIDINTYLKRNFAPFEQRVRSIIRIERSAPVVFEHARRNLHPSLAKPYVETAIEIAEGSATFLERDLVQAVGSLEDPVLRREFEEVNQRAIQEVRGFAEWLKRERLPRSHMRYAIGRSAFQKMLREGELIDLSPGRILAIGLAELEKEKRRFAEAAAVIDPSKPPIEVFRQIQKDHPTIEGLIPDTTRNLERIRQYLIDRNLVSIPSEVRVKVKETPQFLRASSFASMDTPGPFETRATEAFYYVTPAEKEWPKERQEEWLTAFNYYTTDVVSIHEAYPGHYLQALHVNASNATVLEKIFTSYAFVEGWAHYTEQMMIEEGFGDTPGKSSDSLESILSRAKYRLAQSDEALLRLCRLCVAVKTHCQSMTLAEATRFFEQNCYYEAKPAYQEALRGTFDPGYRYYTLGKLQLLKLRDDYQREQGGKFSLRTFHDELLKRGSPPIRLLREQMLQESKIWPHIL